MLKLPHDCILQWNKRLHTYECIRKVVVEFSKWRFPSSFPSSYSTLPVQRNKHRLKLHNEMKVLKVKLNLEDCNLHLCPDPNLSTPRVVECTVDTFYCMTLKRPWLARVPHLITHLQRYSFTIPQNIVRLGS